MRSNTVATRSIRRVRREARPASRAQQTTEVALQIFVFRLDRFLGTMMFDGHTPITIGRHREAGVRLEGDKISRRHCQLVVHEGQVYVEDLGSPNGTFLNRERVVRREPLRATDGLCIGAYTLKVRSMRSAPMPPADEMAADRTTKIEAILEADRTGGTDEVGIDVSQDFNEALYNDAIRRKTGRERPRNATKTSRPPPSAPPPPRLVAEPHLVRPRQALENDSTLLAAHELSLRPDSEQIRLDPEVEARLKDLDDLIASLDERYGKERRGSSIPWRQDAALTPTPAPAPKSKIPDAMMAEDSSLPGPSHLSTREFARDLASRLALDGAVVATPRVETLPPPIEEDEPTEATDDGPETELVDRDISVLMEPRLPSIVAKTKTPITEDRRPPIHEAMLLTPTPGEQAALPPERWQQDGEASFYDDVWTNASVDGEDIRGPAHPRVVVEKARPGAPRGPIIQKSPKSPSRPAITVRPKSRIDDFDPSAPRPVQRASYDGVEIASRTQGRLVDIAVLRQVGDQFILGHRTPQGSVAPGKSHLGLRLLRINDDRTVDLVFPQDIDGHLVRGKSTVNLKELTEGRRYSCLRLETEDVATLILGEGKATFSYHVRFLTRPKSLFRSLRRSQHELT